MAKRDSVVMDTLYIRSNGMQISEHKARRIRKALKDVLTGTLTIGEFFKQSGKIPPEGIVLEGIDFRNDLSEEHTVVHLVASDLPGLLYVMCNSLARCNLNIHSAKIATWYARAENNFYVTTDGDAQIPDSEFPVWTDRLKNLLQGPAEQG